MNLIKSRYWQYLFLIILLALSMIAFWPKTMESKDIAATDLSEEKMSFNKLSPEEELVIIHKGTERPFTGKYYKHIADGAYICKQCNAPLYRSKDKFDSECGWPSFDDEIPGAIKRTLDADGVRTEISCARCGAHLGHVFEGEQLTSKNIRHCVNSTSLNFIPAESGMTMQKAYFAGGCFWGTEYLLQKTDGVISTRVGYMGGHTSSPTYEQVCNSNTGHTETVEITFDSSKVNFETLAKLFFEIHDPTQLNRQGPDIGDQYRSAIFYSDEQQKDIAEKLRNMLKNKGYKVVTELAKAGTFWEAEKYHQDYYINTGKEPYCHIYQKRF
jgi:peptide methionine sulfoxide reductase msrA/msrB